MQHESIKQNSKSFSSDDLFVNAHFTDVFLDSVSDLIQLVRKQDDFLFRFFVAQRVECLDNKWASANAITLLSQPQESGG